MAERGAARTAVPAGVPAEALVTAEPRIENPTAADFTRTGRSRLSAGRKQGLESARSAREREQGPRSMVLPLADALKEDGRAGLAEALRALHADDGAQFVGRPTLMVASGEQVWLWVDRVVGSVDVWVNDEKFGPFTAATEPAWSIADGVGGAGKPGLTAGENLLVVVSRPGAGGAGRGLRLIVREASTGEDVEASGLEVTDVGASPVTVYVARVVGV
ncbi:MAG: hypothetical protein U0821_25255 [Chloroflexota bacterium]